MKFDIHIISGHITLMVMGCLNPDGDSNITCDSIEAAKQKALEFIPMNDEQVARLQKPYHWLLC